MANFDSNVWLAAMSAFGAGYNIAYLEINKQLAKATNSYSFKKLFNFWSAALLYSTICLQFLLDTLSQACERWIIDIRVGLFLVPLIIGLLWWKQVGGDPQLQDPRFQKDMKDVIHPIAFLTGITVLSVGIGFLVAAILPTNLKYLGVSLALILMASAFLGVGLISKQKHNS